MNLTLENTDTSDINIIFNTISILLTFIFGIFGIFGICTSCKICKRSCKICERSCKICERSYNICKLLSSEDIIYINTMTQNGIRCKRNVEV